MKKKRKRQTQYRDRIEAGSGNRTRIVSLEGQGLQSTFIHHFLFNVSNSKPNVKLWFHSAPLWKTDKLTNGRREQNYKKNSTHNIYVSLSMHSKHPAFQMIPIDSNNLFFFQLLRSLFLFEIILRKSIFFLSS